MGILFRRERGGINFSRVGRLALVSLIVSISAAFISTIWAIYLDSFFNNPAYVGFFSAFLTLVSFFSFFFIIPIIEKSSKSKIFSYSLIWHAVTYFLFAVNHNFYILIILSFISTVVLTLRITSFGIIIKDYSKRAQLSRNEGVIYTFFNLAFAVCPLIAAYLAGRYGVNLVFLLSSVFFFLALLCFKMLRIKDLNIKKKPDFNITKNFFAFFKSKDRVISYILGGGVNLWWILIFLFMPLFILRQGLDDLWIGYFLFASMVPLVALTYLFAKKAGKIGFKRIFKIGFLIPAVLSFFCFFIGNVYWVLGLLSLASVGLAMLESTTESYFFDISKKKEELRFYGPYNTTIDVNQFIGSLLSATLLLVLPFKYIFLLFASFMFFMFFISFKVRKIVESKRKK